MQCEFGAGEIQEPQSLLSASTSTSRLETLQRTKSTLEAWLSMDRIRVVALFVCVVGIGSAHGDKPTGANRMTVVCDAFGKTDALKKDWGFSALVEYGGKRILFDCGNDAEAFKRNTESLKIDLSKLDAVVISHRHGDHTAGLTHVVSMNPGVTVYAPFDEPFNRTTPKDFYAPGVKSLPKHMRYFDGEEPAATPHGVAWPSAKLIRLKERREIAAGIHLVPTVSQVRGTLEMPELALAVVSPEGLILLTGCGHSGIENVIEASTAIDARIRLLAGGFHLVSTKEDEIERVSVNLRERWKVQAVAPGHCTSELGFLTLMRHFGDRYQYAGVGETISLP